MSRAVMNSVAKGTISPENACCVATALEHSMTRTVAFVLSGLIVGIPLGHAAAPPAWIAQSNEFAQIPLAVTARYFPEQATQLGIVDADREIADLRPNIYERYVADVQKAAEALRAKLFGTADARVLRDLEIMIKAQDDAATTAQLRRRLLVEHIDVGQIEF